MKFSSIALTFYLFTTLASCGGNNSSKEPAGKNGLMIDAADSVAMLNNKAAAMLTTVKPFLTNELSKWTQSFEGLHTDSFHFSHLGSFEQIDYQSTDSLLNFYSFYKTSLIFSPDSSQFIDLFSAGIALERKGKKIIAMSDVDQAITLCNLQTKEWKRIAFFGPSAGIEETVWVDSTHFIMAGIIHNDDGQPTPLLLLGDIDAKKFFWFEAKNTRPAAITYESNVMKNLKIDEWE